MIFVSILITRFIIVLYYVFNNFTNVKVTITLHKIGYYLILLLNVEIFYNFTCMYVCTFNFVSNLPVNKKVPFIIIERSKNFLMRFLWINWNLKNINVNTSQKIYINYMYLFTYDNKWEVSRETGYTKPLFHVFMCVFLKRMS